MMHPSPSKALERMYFQYRLDQLNWMMYEHIVYDEKLVNPKAVAKGRFV